MQYFQFLASRVYHFLHDHSEDGRVLNALIQSTVAMKKEIDNLKNKIQLLEKKRDKDV